MFELKQAERMFVKRFPFMETMFERGLLQAVFSDTDSIEIVPTSQALALGATTLSYYRSSKLI